ncbi:MAG: flagellar basal-body rod protein FlgG [Planctomycetota bacterium]|jgi:flagellar basal-body rod protein FlgG
MAVNALHSAATGLTALSTQIDVIANNLANVNTMGFKSSRTNFEDLLYQELRQPGVENANGDISPAGIQVGLGVRVSNTQRDFNKQGGAVDTGNALDLRIDGQGFFVVDLVEEEADGLGYTRSGNFFINREGDIVLGNSDGPRLEPPINIPADAEAVEISADGKVLYMPAGGTEMEIAGNIELANFVNPAGLRPIGGNIYVESGGSGPANTDDPGTEGFGTIIAGQLEGSNVDPVTELVDLIKAQRAFEMNSQSIQAADEALQVVSNLRR